MFMDISSEMIHGLLPVFLVSVLGANATTVGLIEGLGEGIALMTRVISGFTSDRLGKRKVFIVTGYLMGTLTKPLFAMAKGIGLILSARLFDRFGKGLRGAPRDALVAELTPPHQLGAAFGLRQSLDSLGAFFGPLLAVVLMTISANNFRLVFWLALIPGIIAVTLLVFFIHEPQATSTGPNGRSMHFANLRKLSGSYWLAVVLGLIFTLARFSEAFLLLRARDTGMAVNVVPVILLVMSLIYALGAYPAGHLSDQVGRRKLLGAGLLVLVAADVVLALAGSPLWTIMGAGLWGLHMAFTQGIFTALVADTAPKALRATGFGIFGLVTGLGVFLASILAGLLWGRYGASVTFAAGAIFAMLTWIGFLLLKRRS